MLFKSLRAPNVKISLSTNKDTFNPGESIKGSLTVSSQEDFEADEIRVELVAVERLRPGGGFVRDNWENSDSRMYSPMNQDASKSSNAEYEMYRGRVIVSRECRVPVNFNQQFPFQIQVPPNLGPTFQGIRKDGRQLQRTWALNAVVAVGGRPDVGTKKEISVLIPAPQASMATQITVATATLEQGAQTVEIPIISAQPEQSDEMITSCPKCGAAINPSQEDVVVTCKYCRYTVTLASRDTIKVHSMLENHMFAQQAVEAAQRYMDKGIFRSGVASEAQITNVKLRYLPFWTFPVNTYTTYSGVTGSGLSGEMNQVRNAFSDKRSGMLSKFGSLMKAGASAYLESQQKNRCPRTVSLSFSSQYTWPILARKSGTSGINYYEVPVARKIPFDHGRIESDAEFLNTEFKQEEAKMNVKAEVEDRERKVACGKVDILQSCSVNTTIFDGELVHAPIWFVNYVLNGENYTILVDGFEGKVLGGGKPLFHM